MRRSRSRRKRVLYFSTARVAMTSKPAAEWSISSRRATAIPAAGDSLRTSAGELAAPLIAEESMMTNSLARTDGPTAAFCVALADRYRVGAELGRGGMATVFAAEDLRHHRRVAIKVLDPDLGAMLGADRFPRRDSGHRKPPASQPASAVRLW
jgi:hypothetical protein